MTIELGPITFNFWFLGIAGSLGAALGLWLKGHRERRKREYKVSQEYSGIKDARELLWVAVRDAYQRFQKTRPQAPDSLEALLTVVGMPPDVGSRAGRDLRLWPEEHSRHLNPDQRLLWDFAQLVYPAKGQRTGKITDHTFISSEMANEFHKARGNLAHFWSRAPRDVRTSFFVKHYSSAALDIFLLSWFDIALKQWTGDSDEGKVNLFKVGKAIASASKVG